MMKRLVLLLFLPLVVVSLVLAVLLRGDGELEAPPVRVVRGTVVRYAVATGRVQPAFEVPVKSRNGGVLTRRFVTLGQRVEEGDPLVEVRPVLTDLDMLQAERALIAAREAEKNVEEFREGANLMGRTMLFLQGRNNVERMRKGAERARADAENQLELLRQGQAEVEGKRIDFLVRAPVTGTVIALPVEPGVPVVPSSSFGSGTEVVVLADLDHPVFRGTVNEIEVGRLREGMQAALEVGALAEIPVMGELVEIALRSRIVNNATVFDVELRVAPPEDVVLRSGYSAVARIEIDRAEDVLVLPERVVDYRGKLAFVRVPGEQGKEQEKEVSCGLSDGITVEITDGLAEGDEVLERVY